MKRILLLVAICLLAACGNNTTNTPNTPASNKLDKLSWMIGTWDMPSPDGETRFTEHWEKADANSMSGHGFMISKAGDTLFREELQLVNESEVLWYIPTVSNQNDAQPVRFREKVVSENEVAFENMAHDFPQRIIYQRKGDKAMYARVEGMQSNSLRKEEFTFTKQQ